MISYGRQEITQDDIDAVVAVLRSDFLTQGPAVPRFEAAVAQRVKANHAVAVNSATSALHIACMALDLGAGDILWTVPNTFVASANCARYCNAHVDFIDIDPLTWNLSVTALEQKLVHARKIGRLPKIVVPVHFAGQPTDQEAIRELSNEFGFKIIEDASHSIGANRRGEPVGSCRWSDITVFSFHPVKIITSGEGGMATTNDEALAEKMALYRSHGITRNAKQFRNPVVEESTAGWYYEQLALGFNYRLTDIQAALGTSQLDRLDAYIDRRNAVAKRYDTELAELPLQLPTVSQGNRSAFHLYVVRCISSSITRREMYEQLRSRGIGVNLHYMPVHLQPYYQDLGFREGQFPEAEAYAREAITLPLYAAMSDGTQEQVMTAVREVLSSSK